jgi:hypothetical protein
MNTHLERQARIVKETANVAIECADDLEFW